PDGMNDARVGNWGRCDMLQLQLLSYSFTDNAKIANATAWAIVVALAALYVRTGRNSRDTLGLSAAAGILALLAVYHRLYDAGIIALAIAWGLRNLNGTTRWLGRAVLLLIFPFMIREIWFYQFLHGPTGR